MSDLLLRSVFRRTLLDQRRALLGFGLGIAAFTLLVGGIWPTVRDQAEEFQRLLDTYPPALKAAFDISTFDGAGFLKAEMFSLILPLLFLIHAIGRGADLVAGEEERGSLDTLLVQPLSRKRILLQKVAGLAAGLGALALVAFVALALVTTVGAFGVGLLRLAGAVGLLFLLGLFFGMLALSIGALRSGRGLAVGLASAVAAASYVLLVAARLVPAIEPLRWASAFHYYSGSDPLVHGAAPLHALVLALATVGLALGALAAFDRRDVGAA